MFGSETKVLLAQGTVYGPSATQALGNRSGINSHFTGPCLQMLGAPLMGEGHRGSAIGSLLAPIRPAAVIGFVMAVIVLTLQGQAGGGMAHVSDEVFEAVPPFAHVDTSPAIAWVGGVRGVVAAFQHQLPDVVDPSPAQSMSRLLHSRELALKTAAALSPFAQTARKESLLDAAVTPAQPALGWPSVSGRRFTATSISEYDQSAVSPAGEILEPSVISDRLIHLRPPCCNSIIPRMAVTTKTGTFYVWVGD